MKQEDYCSVSCPYLKKVPDEKTPRLPFYCELFRVFLGVEEGNVCRCEACIGKSLNAKKEGYHLISSYPQSGLDKRKTKWGFRRLPAAVQDRFVRLLKQSGVLMGVDEKMPLNSTSMLDALCSQMDTVDGANFDSQTAQTQLFSDLLDKMGADFPEFVKDSSKDLLSNLFLSLDQSEQNLMLSVLSNPARAESFLKEFEEMPKNDHMIKDLRRTLDEEQRKMEEEEQRRQRSLDQQRLMQLAHARAGQEKGGR